MNVNDRLLGSQSIDDDQYQINKSEASILDEFHEIKEENFNRSNSFHFINTSSYAHSSSDPLLDSRQLSDEIDNDRKRNYCCSSLSIFTDEIPEVKSIALVNVARGLIIVSGIFVSSALLRLASIAAGCKSTENDECNSEIIGLKPSSLITLISFSSGVFIAFTMPFIGTVLEYTSLRKFIGSLTAFLLWFIPTMEYFFMIHPSTWFALCLLQVFYTFLYHLQVFTITTYLPQIGRLVGTVRMTDLTALYKSTQFISCLVFLVAINMISIGITLLVNNRDKDLMDDDDSDKTDQPAISNNVIQSLRVCLVTNMIGLPPLFTLAWKNMPHVGPERETGTRDKSLFHLWTIGYRQMWNTANMINEKYRDGLRCFFLTITFTEAGMSAFSSISLVYMIETLGASSVEIGILFLLVFFCIVPGSFIGAKATKKIKNPLKSWKTSILAFSVVTALGAFVLDRPERKRFAYLWAIFWGLLMGWYYSHVDLIFSLSVPKAEASGLAGFFSYCSLVLTWLPPLLFTILNEIGVGMKWGLLSLVIFFVIPLIFLNAMAPWENIHQVAHADQTDQSQETDD